MRKKGFTIIELLVVIVIIGLLTGLAASSYVNAQRNARDNARKAGVSSIATALEAHYRVKQRFPGKIGNESDAPDATQAGIWSGCLAVDSNPVYKSVVYYSFPTVPNGTGAQQPCNQRVGTAKGFDRTEFAPYPVWIPGMGEFLNPFPVEKQYHNASGDSAAPLDAGDPNSFSASKDVLGNNSALSYAYRKLTGGYMVYARLENTSTDTPVNTPLTDTPTYTGLNGNPVPITVYGTNVYMIRK